MLIVTFAFNIPLNDDLERAGYPARIGDVAAGRDDFATTWIAWNVVRTLAGTAAFACLAWAAFACLAWALLVHGRAGPRYDSFRQSEVASASLRLPHPRRKTWP